MMLRELFSIRDEGQVAAQNTATKTHASETQTDRRVGPEQIRERRSVKITKGKQATE
jgi:hypothetical protein